MKYIPKLCAIAAVSIAGFHADAGGIDNDRSQEFVKEMEFERVTVNGVRMMGSYTSGSDVVQTMRNKHDLSTGGSAGGIGGSKKSEPPVKEKAYTNDEIASDILSVNNGLVVGLLVTGYAVTFPVSAPVALVLVPVSALIAGVVTRGMLEIGNM